MRCRLFALSGSSQLVPALAAAEKMAGSQEPSSFADYLVLYGLNEPVHGLPFADVIARLARQLRGWQRIVYFSKQEIRALSWKRRSTAIGMMRARLGVEVAEELYLNCVPHHCSGMLAAAFPRAMGICFGDGIGVNYSPGYFRVGGRDWLSRGWTRFRHFAGRGIFPRIRPRIDRYCLLLPNLFDTSAREFDQCDPQTCRVLLHQLAESLDTIIGPQSELDAALQRASQVVLCLTCNFSEARRMTLESECQAYHEYLAQIATDPDSLLIVKPHPRDNPDKIDCMRKLLGRTWRNMYFLAGAPMCYVPFEALYLRYFASVGSKLRLAAFSTACLAIEHLWGAPCCVGFGEQLVRKYFYPHWVESRLTHERHLFQALRRRPVSAQSYEHALVGNAR